jgi:hypothetical protein
VIKMILKRLFLVVLGCMSVSSLSSAAAPPEVVISNETVRARLYLPDAQAGFYRGTRFDWSGVISGLEFAGHDFFPPWFQRMDTKVHDFIYDGQDIVAGPCTAITGPAEEFARPLGFDQARAGDTFVKIGVGALRRPDGSKYDAFHSYEVADAGKWTVGHASDSIQFRQELTDSGSGYAYDYRKTVSLIGNRPQLVLQHTLRNTGRRPIQTSVYNHNFLYLDRQAPGPDMTITLPFQIQANPVPDAKLAQIQQNQFRFVKTLAGEDRVYMTIQGFGAEAKDYNIRIENRAAGMGVHITADRPLSRMALWTIRAPLSVEPFIDVAVDPGAEFTWRIAYEFFSLKR